MISHFFIDRPIFATVLSVVIVILGGVALIELPVAQYPDVTPPTVQVSATYPGANARTTADNVATPIELEVNGVERMLYMSSKSTNDGQMNLDVTFDVGDAESLPYPDESFDILTSSVGAIFAPDHEAVASELARTCRPGGRLALSAWATDGGVDEFFEIIARYAPPPPPGAGTALQWGEASYCEKMLGDAFELTITTHNTPQEEESGEAVWELLSTSFGPIKTLLGNLPEERLNLPQLDPHAAKLYLLVRPTEVRDGTIGTVAPNIAGPKKARIQLIAERVGHE